MSRDESKNRVYKVNVGGRVFVFSHQTLFGPNSTEGCYLHNRINSAWNGDNDSILDHLPYIDRRPDTFELVLNFLRGYPLVLPDDETLCEYLKTDAEFYGLAQLTAAIDADKKNQELLCEAKENEVFESSIPKDYREKDTEEWLQEFKEIINQSGILDQAGLWNGPKLTMPDIFASRREVWEAFDFARRYYTLSKNKIEAKEVVQANINLVSAVAAMAEIIVSKKTGKEVKITEVLDEALNAICSSLIETKYELLNKESEAKFLGCAKPLTDADYYTKFVTPLMMSAIQCFLPIVQS